MQPQPKNKLNMLHLTYKNKIKVERVENVESVEPVEHVETVINKIAELLKKQYDCNNITSEQLTKIQNLAADTEQLKTVLTFL